MLNHEITKPQKQVHSDGAISHFEQTDTVKRDVNIGTPRPMKIIDVNISGRIFKPNNTIKSLIYLYL